MSAFVLDNSVAMRWCFENANNPYAEAVLQRMADGNIEIDTRGSGRVFVEVHAVATRYRLTGYDAVYLELALRRNLPLATLDAELARACVAAGGSVL